MLLFGGATATAAEIKSPTDIEQSVRQCVAGAANPTAIVACEVAARQRWQQLLQQTHEALEKRLSGPALESLQRSSAAWETYRRAEYALLRLSLGQRRDGLALPLMEGAKTDLVRQRVELLRAHLASVPNSD